MIDCDNFLTILKKNGIKFYTGVPGSILKNFCRRLLTEEKHIMAANEGAAIALAAGYHLATGEIGLVYMQNSGLGNAINPITSLIDEDVYQIPILMLIGLRGGKHDEVQHKRMGKITKSLLKLVNIPYALLPPNEFKAKKLISKAIAKIKKTNNSFALLVKPNTFSPYQLKQKSLISSDLSREDAIKIILDSLGEKDILVTTTGKASREVFEYRIQKEGKFYRDFLTVGSMGHSSQIALGIAISKPDREVYCLDGDGAALMHLGSLQVIALQEVKNFKHILVNNQAHDSVGGIFFTKPIEFTKLAKAMGYTATITVKNKQELKKGIEFLKKIEGPCLLEILVRRGARSTLSRPSVAPIVRKKRFMEFLK